MGNLVFITDRIQQKTLHYIAPALTNKRVILIGLSADENLTQPDRLEMITPISNLSIKSIVQLLPFYLGLDCDLIEFIVPENSKMTERLMWDFYFSFVKAIRPQQVRRIPAAEAFSNQLFSRSSQLLGYQTRTAKPKGTSILVPHAVSQLDEQSLHLINGFANRGQSVMIWGWGETSIAQRHLVRRLFAKNIGNIIIRDRDPNERSQDLLNSKSVFICNSEFQLFAEEDLIEAYLSNLTGVIFYQDTIAKMKAPWILNSNCLKLSKIQDLEDQSHLDQWLASPHSAKEELRLYLEAKENSRLRKWSMDEVRKLR